MSKRSISIGKSSHKIMRHIHKTKSEDFMEPQDRPNLKTEWYSTMCRNRVSSYLPSYIPTYNHTQPYKLTITKVQNLSLLKKSSYSQQFLCIQAVLISNKSDVIGRKVTYQCEYAVAENKYEQPISLYYHSRVDRNTNIVKLILIFEIIELRDEVIEGRHKLGVHVISDPFVEKEIKNGSLYKDTPVFDLLGDISVGLQSSSISIAYKIESFLELRTIVKMIPAECLFSSQDHISSVFGGYLLDSPEREEIPEEDVITVQVSYLQIHIPKEFDDEVINALRRMPQFAATSLNSIDSRQLMIGFHNEYQFVSPSTRKLYFVEQESTGEFVIRNYQFMGENQLIKIPFYTNDDSDANRYSAFAASLVYMIDEMSVEVAFFAMQPKLNGENDEVSVNMIAGSGDGLMGNLLAVQCQSRPAIILQYKSQDILAELSDIDDQYRSPSRKRLKSNYKLPLNSSKRVTSQNELKEKEKILEELEMERQARQALEKEKVELDMRKSQDARIHKEQFDRKFESEREQLMRRHNRIENQCRQEVEREIKQKKQLENQLRFTKQKLAMMEQKEKHNYASKKLSYEQSPSAEYDPQLTGGFPPYSRHRVNPIYYIDEEKTVPVKQVREIRQKNIKKNKADIQLQYEHFNMASKFTFHFTSIIWSAHIEVPKEFFFVIRFFNFREFHTDTLTCLDQGSQYQTLVKVNHYTHSHQNVEPVYSYTVDPSKYSNPKLLHHDLTDYISNNNAIIDVFGENYIYIGQINIKLHELLRGNKEHMLVAKENNILKVRGKEKFGTLQVLLKNERAECEEILDIEHNKKEKQIRKKVISHHPIALPSNTNQQNELKSTKQKSSNRLEQRIANYKKNKVMQNRHIQQFDDLNEQEKGQMLKKIYDFKQKKMPQYISKLYENLLTQHMTICPYFGQTSTFIYEFVNTSRHSAAYRISIHDEEGEEELEVVKNSGEWKYFKSQYGYPMPKSFDCINMDNCFYLGPGESIPILFKYLSFRTLEGDASSRDKVINVTIVKEDSSWIMGGFSLQVQPHEPIVHHSYILYEPAGQLVDLIMPVIYSSPDVKFTKRLYLTTEEGQAEWLNEYEIMLRMQTGEVMGKHRFNLLLYEDEYFDVLRENWSIQVHAYEGVCTTSRPDDKTKFKICIPEHVAHQFVGSYLTLHSSSSDLALLENTITADRLKKGAVEIFCQVIGEGNKEIQVTCLDNHQALVYGYVVQVLPYILKKY